VLLAGPGGFRGGVNTSCRWGRGLVGCVVVCESCYSGEYWVELFGFQYPWLASGSRLFQVVTRSGSSSMDR